MTASLEGVATGALVPPQRQGEVYAQPPLPVAEWVDYRVLCDYETDAFRHVGVQDPDAYRAAVSDSRTVFLPIEGRLYPAAIPVGYEKMYAADRCRELTGKDEVLLLSLPLDRVRDGQLASGNLVGGEGLPDDFAIIVEQHRPDEAGYDAERDHESIAAQMIGFGEVRPNEFVNEMLATKPDHRTAWMAIYDFAIEPVSTDYAGRYAGLNAEERIDQVWAEHKAENDIPDRPAEDSNETYLYSAQELRDNPEVVEALWRISEKGFGKILGAYHPVSMEFNREFFDRQLMTDGIYTAVRYHEGRPVCFGSMAQNMDHNEWLDLTSTVLQGKFREVIQKGQAIVHFFELISDETGLNLSTDILDLYLKLVGRTGQPHRVFFESTNLSSLYIPKIVRRGVDESPHVVMSEPVEKVATLDYWFLTKDATKSE